MPEYFHLAIAWDWEHDRDFVRLLEEQAHAQQLLSYSISYHNAHEALKRIQKGDLAFGAFLDRASEEDAGFAALSRGIQKTGTLFVNAPEALAHATDKATMHLEFLARHIEVPYTIIISPYNKKREIEFGLTELARLGRPFIIKPANTTGGGIGVILGAETLKDVIDTRQHHKNDKYLLQEKIAPATLGGRMGWFRVFCVYGSILPCWWDDGTHVYKRVTDDEVSAFGLQRLAEVTSTIYDICRLQFFSTEIAVTSDGRLVVVDYVNDICDMRLQSKFADGVPDPAVGEICRGISSNLRVALAPRTIDSLGNVGTCLDG